MKKFLAIILCLCIFVLPMKVVALDCPQVLGTVATNEQTELTAESETLYPANSPEAQAIEKIHAHMRASGETVSIPRSQASGLIDGGIYNIKNYFSGKYLNVCYGTDANGTNVYQYTKDGSVEQKFKVVYDSSTDSYKLYAMCSSNGNNRVIDVKRGGAALASGQNVDIWTPVDHTAQRLEITYLTYNIYHISMKANTGLYLTTRDSSNGTKAGTSATSAGNVHINSFDVNLNQQWAFEYLGNATPEPEPATPTGSLDVVNANVISGWAWRSDLPNSPINVNIQVIGSNGITYLNTTVSANEYNSTIYNTGYGNGYHGFSYNFDFLTAPSGTYTIHAYGIGADGSYSQLTNSPKTYTIDNSVVVHCPLIRQQKSKWCWAACAEMLGKNSNFNATRTQYEVVELIKGYDGSELIDEGGTTTEIAIGSEFVSNNGEDFEDYLPLAIRDIEVLIENGHAIVFCYSPPSSSPDDDGHAVIVYGYKTVLSDSAAGFDNYFIYCDPAQGVMKNKKYSEIYTSSNGRTLYGVVCVAQ